MTVPEISFEIVPASPRRFRATWSYESQQDLRSMHNLDAERALSQTIAREINDEIDAAILADIAMIMSTPNARITSGGPFTNPVVYASPSPRSVEHTPVDWKKEGF